MKQLWDFNRSFMKSYLFFIIWQSKTFNTYEEQSLSVLIVLRRRTLEVNHLERR